MIGEHPDDPLSLPVPVKRYRDVVAEALADPRRSLKVAWSPDLGVAPLDPEVREICSRAVRAFESVGATIDEACPNLQDANAAFSSCVTCSVLVGLETYSRRIGICSAPRSFTTPKGLNQSASGYCNR